VKEAPQAPKKKARNTGGILKITFLGPCPSLFVRAAQTTIFVFCPKL